MLTNNIARKTRITIVPFKATNHDSVDPNERLFEYSDWGPAWATFEQLRDWSWKKASWHLKGLVPAQDFEVYRDALNVGYARVWTMLVENPGFCAGKPYSYLGITAGYKAAQHIVNDILTTVRQHELYPHTTYTNKDKATNFKHLKRKVQWRLLQAYRIYNVEY